MYIHITVIECIISLDHIVQVKLYLYMLTNDHNIFKPMYYILVSFD